MSCDFAALSDIDSTDPDQVAELMQQCTAALTDPSLWLWVVLFTVACTLVGALIGKYKRAVLRDALLGAALGPIGWLISLTLPARAQTCAKCGASAPGSDRFCRRCGQPLRDTPPLRTP